MSPQRGRLKIAQHFSKRTKPIRKPVKRATEFIVAGFHFSRPLHGLLLHIAA